MRDDLMAVEIEVDPTVGAAPLRTTEQSAIKAPRGSKVVNREGKVKGRACHRPHLSLCAKRSNPARCAATLTHDRY
jgi:hypothetical protein